MNITMLQTDIVWENKQENLLRLHEKLKHLQGNTDMVVLPEMCTTGFSMNSKVLAEPNEGSTITLLSQWAVEYNFAIVGSFIASDCGEYYNRAFFLTPEGESHYYNKRHLFRMGNEAAAFSSGNERLIVHYRGWNICVLVCYDLRFPVWSRNVNNEYDLLIYTANWPAVRRKVWNTLLAARAIENMCFVCGVNRVGIDGANLHYDGGSQLISPKGDVVAQADKEEAVTSSIYIEDIQRFREKFPAWKDADKFTLNKC